MSIAYGRSNVKKKKRLLRDLFRRFMPASNLRFFHVHRDQGFVRGLYSRLSCQLTRRCFNDFILFFFFLNIGRDYLLIS